MNWAGKGLSKSELGNQVEPRESGNETVAFLLSGLDERYHGGTDNGKYGITGVMLDVQDVGVDVLRGHSGYLGS